MMKIEASQRLKAQTLMNQPISNSSGNWFCEQYKEAAEKSDWHALGVQNGLELGWFRKTYGPLYCLRDVATGDIVAYAELNDAKIFGLKGYYVAALFVKTAYRGKGLATVLHLGCLHVLKQLTSDVHMALGAVASFQSLQKYGYKVQVFNVDQGIFVPFTWGADKVPVIGGKSMQEYDDEFVFHVAK